MVCLQGMLFSTPDCLKVPTDLVRLWMHEAQRVYKDKLVDEADLQLYDKIVKDSVKKAFEVQWPLTIRSRGIKSTFRLTTSNDFITNKLYVVSFVASHVMGHHYAMY